LGTECLPLALPFVAGKSRGPTEQFRATPFTAAAGFQHGCTTPRRVSGQGKWTRKRKSAREKYGNCPRCQRVGPLLNQEGSFNHRPVATNAAATAGRKLRRGRRASGGGGFPATDGARSAPGSKAAAPIKPGWDTKPASAPAGSRSFRVRQLAAAFYRASLLAAGRLKSPLPEGNGQSVEIPRASSRGGKRQQAAAVQSSARANGLGGGPGVGTTAGGIRVKMSVAYGHQIAGVVGVELSLGEIAQSSNTVCGRRADSIANLAGMAPAVQYWLLGRNC
jgi:hypothetical protein